MFKRLWDYFCRDLRVHPAVAVVSMLGLFSLAVLLPWVLSLVVAH